MNWKLSTAASYAFPVLIVYLLVYLPLSRPPSSQVTADAECDQETLSRLSDHVVRLSTNISCPEHLYNVHILNRDPLVIYIPHFLSDGEADHLVNIRYFPCLLSSLRLPFTHSPPFITIEFPQLTFPSLQRPELRPLHCLRRI